ncbi:MAG: hypothetical protein Q9227_005510 [Pyrenula ochraceoflavens]
MDSQASGTVRPGLNVHYFSTADLLESHTTDDHQVTMNLAPEATDSEYVHVDGVASSEVPAAASTPRPIPGGFTWRKGTFGSAPSFPAFASRGPTQFVGSSHASPDYQSQQHQPRLSEAQLSRLRQNISHHKTLYQNSQRQNAGANVGEGPKQSMPYAPIIVPAYLGSSQAMNGANHVGHSQAQQNTGRQSIMHNPTNDPHHARPYTVSHSCIEKLGKLHVISELYGSPEPIKSETPQVISGHVSLVERVLRKHSRDCQAQQDPDKLASSANSAKDLNQDDLDLETTVRLSFPGNVEARTFKGKLQSLHTETEGNLRIVMENFGDKIGPLKIETVFRLAEPGNGNQNIHEHLDWPFPSLFPNTPRQWFGEKAKVSSEVSKNESKEAILEFLAPVKEQLAKNAQTAQELNEKLGDISTNLALMVQGMNERGKQETEELNKLGNISDNIASLVKVMNDKGKQENEKVNKLEEPKPLVIRGHAMDMPLSLPPPLTIPVTWNDHYLNKIPAKALKGKHMYLAIPANVEKSITYDLDKCISTITKSLEIDLYLLLFYEDHPVDSLRTTYPPSTKALPTGGSADIKQRQNLEFNPMAALLLPPLTAQLIHQPHFEALFHALAIFVGKHGWRLGWTELDEMD